MPLSKRTVNSIDNVHQLQPFVIAIVFPTLATIAIILRLISKRLIKAPFGMDDYMIVAALVPLHIATRNVIEALTAASSFSSMDWRHVTF